MTIIASVVPVEAALSMTRPFCVPDDEALVSVIVDELAEVVEEKAWLIESSESESSVNVRSDVEPGANVLLPVSVKSKAWFTESASPVKVIPFEAERLVLLEISSEPATSAVAKSTALVVEPEPMKIEAVNVSEICESVRPLRLDSVSIADSIVDSVVASIVVTEFRVAVERTVGASVPVDASYSRPPSVLTASEPVAESKIATNDVASVPSTTVTVLASVARSTVMLFGT
jgi:hypothetical protein